MKIELDLHEMDFDLKESRFEFEFEIRKRRATSALLLPRTRQQSG
jgi:hypothetical protein